MKIKPKRIYVSAKDKGRIDLTEYIFVHKHNMDDVVIVLVDENTDEYMKLDSLNIAKAMEDILCDEFKVKEDTYYLENASR